MLRAARSLSQQKLLNPRKTFSYGIRNFSDNSGRGGSFDPHGRGRGLRNANDDVSKEMPKIGRPTYSDKVLDQAYDDSKPSQISSAHRHDSQKFELRQASGAGRGKNNSSSVSKIENEIGTNNQIPSSNFADFSNMRDETRIELDGNKTFSTLDSKPSRPLLKDESTSPVSHSSSKPDAHEPKPEPSKHALPNQTKRSVLSETAYLRMVSAYQKKGRDDDLSRTLHEMQSAGYALSPELQLTLLKSQIKLNNGDAAETTLNDLQRSGNVIEPSIFNSMIEMYAELGNIEKMERMVQLFDESSSNSSIINQTSTDTVEQSLYPPPGIDHHPQHSQSISSKHAVNLPETSPVDSHTVEGSSSLHSPLFDASENSSPSKKDGNLHSESEVHYPSPHSSFQPSPEGLNLKKEGTIAIETVVDEEESKQESSDFELKQKVELTDDDREVMRERMRMRQSQEVEVIDSLNIPVAKDYSHVQETKILTKPEVSESIHVAKPETYRQVETELKTAENSVKSPEILTSEQQKSPEDTQSQTSTHPSLSPVETEENFMVGVNKRPNMTSFLNEFQSDKAYVGSGRGRGGVSSPNLSQQRKIGKPANYPIGATDDGTASFHASVAGSGMGRGSVKETLPPLSKEEAIERAVSLLTKGHRREQERRQAEREKGQQVLERQVGMQTGSEDKTPVIKENKPQLSKEEAIERAISVLLEGREKVQRSRRSAINDFAADVFANRRGGPSQPGSDQTNITVRQRSPRRASSPSSRKKSKVEESKEFYRILQSLQPANAEEEKELEMLQSYFDMENDVERQLHFNFQKHFEPEYMMEDFGKNPDIYDSPPPTLKEYLEDVKNELLQKGEVDAEDWEEGVNDVLHRAEILEALTEKYTGPQKVTSRQECNTLSEIVATLPQQKSPEIDAFATRALRSLQSNPSWTFEQKAKVLSSIVNGFSSQGHQQPPT